MPLPATDQQARAHSPQDVNAQYRELQELRERVAEEVARLIQMPPVSNKRH